MARSPEVYEATKNYVVAALRYLDEHHESGPTSVMALERWVRAGPGRFVRQAHTEEAWSPQYRRLDEEIHALPEFRECDAALRRDEVIGPQLETLVGSRPLGARRIDVDLVPDAILARLATDVRGWRFDEARFDALYEDYESALHADSFTGLLVVPLPGLLSEALPIRLDQDVLIDEMTEQEALDCVRTGLFPPWPGSWPMIQIPSEAAVRARFDLPKVVGEDEFDAHQEDTASLFTEMRELAERAVLALRLSTSSRIVAPGYIHFSNEFPLRGGTGFTPLGGSPRHTMWATAYELDDEAVGSLRDCWRQLASHGVKRRRELGVALRRFSDAGDRERDDDALIDLMIAAEALFLPNIRDELGYRLALRAAFFISSEMGRPRRDVFSHMKRAYDARSVAGPWRRSCRP